VSKWNVSSSNSMNRMFYDAKSFSRTLCGREWVQSKAKQNSMFTGSSGSIDEACRLTAATTMSTSACSKCFASQSGKLSCCASGGSWFNKCGKAGDSKFDHTWAEGVEACKATTAPTITKAISSVCSKCGIIKKTGISSCCARRGSWFQDCGDAGDENFGHTWLEGIQSCKAVATTAPAITKAISSVCSKCGTIKKTGISSCCARGGSWFEDCGDAGDDNFGHTWFEGIQSCKVTTAPAITKAISSVCSKCGTIKKTGISSCCARGGSWFEDCGDAGDDNFGHTWFEGIQACKTISSLSAESNSRRIPHEKAVVDQQSRAAAQSQSTGDLHRDHVHGVVTANSKGCDMLTSTVAWASFSLIFLYV